MRAVSLPAPDLDADRYVMARLLLLHHTGDMAAGLELVHLRSRAFSLAHDA